jgi:hypothetical protein
MSRGEKYMYIAIALMFLLLFIVMAVGHIPDGG